MAEVIVCSKCGTLYSIESKTIEKDKQIGFCVICGKNFTYNDISQSQTNFSDFVETGKVKKKDLLHKINIYNLNYKLPKKTTSIKNKNGYFVFCKFDGICYGANGTSIIVDAKDKFDITIDELFSKGNFELFTDANDYIAREKAYDLMKDKNAEYGDKNRGQSCVMQINNNKIQFVFEENLNMKQSKQQIKESFSYVGIDDITSDEAYEAGVYEDILTEFFGISSEAINLVVSINGRNIDTYNDILKAVTGYEDLNQIDL